VHELWDRNVFYQYWGLSQFDVPHLSVKLQLACGERSFDELHLQCGLFWARWRHMHSVRGWKVQDVNRISQLQRMSNKLQLACGDLSSGKLHLQFGLFGA
jgi:hypothetical protein